MATAMKLLLSLISSLKKTTRKKEFGRCFIVDQPDDLGTEAKIETFVWFDWFYG
jgi:hypothetical protein